MKFGWDAKFGPASIIGAIGALASMLQVGIVAFGVSSWFSHIDDNQLQTQRVVSKLTELVETVQAGQRVQSERITRLEEKSSQAEHSLDRIDRKLDTIKLRP